MVGLAVCLLTLPVVAAPPAHARQGDQDGPEPTVDPSLYQALQYRLVGPFRGGRVTAVTGVASQPRTFYMGSTGGGVWKTTDSGETWTNVSDDQGFGSASVGAVAVAPSDPNVVYAGMGSACIRGNVSAGDGVYRSTDAGKTWTHAGLEEAGQIGDVQVHPDDPDRVFVAALGHAFGPNEQRGVFRSTDGGDTWEKVLYVSEKAGAVDLALDPTNPRILFAGIWQAERKPWTLISGGEGSGLYRSTDGGDTWTEVTKGLPEGIMGKIAVTVSPANPDRVWALIEAEDGGLFRSDDGGESFRLINGDREFRQRAWYYTHVHADPKDAETVYILNVGMFRSTDGGASFKPVRTPHGDNHDLWINPDDPEIMIEGNDGGANVSTNGGRTWSTQANQPTAELYRVTVDDRFPYRLYAAQQDNSTLSIPHRTSTGAPIDEHDWYPVGGGESGHIAVDPENPDVVYAGSYGGTITRYDHDTGRSRNIMTYPQMAVGAAAKNLEFRFQWNAPIRISPHDPDVLYHASNVVHRSTDEGQSWEVISPDLTRNAEDKQDYAGGPITWDNTGVEVYGTIFALEESPHEAGVLWAGSDDGLVHLSRDGGETWTDVTPDGVPEWATVNTIELSAHAPGRAFLAVQRYRMDDFAPYVFRTDDHGASWELLTDGTNGIPADHFVRVVREDPAHEGLLYAGTELGMYVSFDDGESWQTLQLNLPTTPVTDLQVKGDDLVVATQGRSLWVLDHLAPLHQIAGRLAEGRADSTGLTLDAVAGDGIHLYDPEDPYRMPGGGIFASLFGSGRAGQNPTAGAVLYYVLPEELGEDRELTLEILGPPGQDDRVIRSFSSTTPERQAPSPFARFFPQFAGGRTLPAEEGMNRWVWDLRHPDARLVDDAVLWGGANGPEVSPGTYRARLTLGDASRTVSFDVLPDPRLETTPADYEAQEELALDVLGKLNETHDAIRTIRSVREQVNGLVARLKEGGHDVEELREAAAAVTEPLGELEQELTQTKSRSTQDPLNFPPKLDNQYVYLLGVVTDTDAGPTDGSHTRFEDLNARLAGHRAELERILETELAAFEEMARQAGAAPVIVPAGGDS
jgi:photosystem II stability/assembly factor-like uncharacterized protein